MHTRDGTKVTRTSYDTSDRACGAKTYDKVRVARTCRNPRCACSSDRIGGAFDRDRVHCTSTSTDSRTATSSERTCGTAFSPGKAHCTNLSSEPDPLIEYMATSLVKQYTGVTYAKNAPVTACVAGVPAGAYEAPAPVRACVAPTPAVTCCHLHGNSSSHQTRASSTCCHVHNTAARMYGALTCDRVHCTNTRSDGCCG